MPNFAATSLLFATLLAAGALLMVPCHGAPPFRGDNYYVKPSFGMAWECPSNASEEYCMTLDEFANPNNTQNLEGNVRMVFFGGVHYLTKEMNLSGVENVHMIPANSMREFFNDTEVKIQVVNCNMIFDSVGSLTLEDLIITGANLILENAPKRHADIRDVNLLESSLLHRYGSDVNTPMPPNTVQDSNSPPHAHIRIENSILEHSGGTGLKIMDERLRGDLKVDIQNSSISYHRQGGIIVESTTRLHFTITDSTIEGNTIGSSGSVYSAAAGLGIYSSRPDSARVSIRGTLFADNQDLRGVPMVVWVSRAVVVEIEDSEFQDNRGTAVRVANIKDSLRLRGNVTFRNNQAQNGGALALVSTVVDFMPSSYIVFEDNHANDVGGAIFVESSSTMYEENNPNTYVSCFYRFPEMNSDDNVRNLTFGNNSANRGGHGIFGGSLRSYCLVDVLKPKDEDQIRSGDPLVQDSFLFNETTDERMASLVSSSPSRICVLDPEDSEKSFSESCADTSQIFMTLSAYPGKEFSLKVVLAGAEFGTGTGQVHAQFLPINDVEPRLQPQYQHSQEVDQLNTPKTLKYSVFSRNSLEVLVLTTTDGAILSYGDEDQIQQDFEIYNSSGIIPVGLLTTPIYINISLSKCPSGFYLDSKSMGCKCNPQVCSDEDSAGGKELLYFGENLWVNAYDDGNVNGIILHYNCPYDYCKSSSNGINLQYPDAQCAMDHAGVLCGKCESGFSMALGSNRCLPCSNDNVALILFFGLAGFLLVFFIHVLNMTVSQGTIGGLIFYANIVWAYRSIFFAHHEDWFLKMFVAWLNLDFGIEACFSRELTAYGKSWLQYVFPLYVWGIAGGIMLLAYCSERLARRYRNSSTVHLLVRIASFFGDNSIQVLATLFILSYAKLLRTSITALVPANLYVYTDTGERVDNLTKVVWAFDGNLDYGRVPHVFLLLVALLVLIFLLAPYTLALLFVQPLRIGSKYRCLKWVDAVRPFFDAYTAPLKPPNHFWVGLLLLARFILLLTFIVTYASNPSTSLVALVIVVMLLLVILTFTDQLYEDPTKSNIRFLPEKISFRLLMEISFLLNLVVVGVSVLSVDFITGNIHTKAAVIYMSVLIAFFQFLGLILFHLWRAVKKKSCMPVGVRINCIWRGGYKNLEADDTALTTAPATASDDGGDQHQKLQANRDAATPTPAPAVTTMPLVGANTVTTANYHTTYDTSEPCKPMLTESTTDKDLPPPNYNSTELCKSTFTGSTVKGDQLSTFTSSSELRKPMLTESTTDKDRHLSYNSFELCKPGLTDTTTA